MNPDRQYDTRGGFFPAFSIRGHGVTAAAREYLKRLSGHGSRTVRASWWKDRGGLNLTAGGRRYRVEGMPGLEGMPFGRPTAVFRLPDYQAAGRIIGG